jgi:hypothetical protein
MRRPYAVSELHTTLLAGCNICPVLVKREGMKVLDFDAVQKDIDAGRIGSYMDASGWALLRNFNIGPQDLARDLHTVLNVRAYEFSMSLATYSMGNELLDGQRAADEGH